MARLIVFVAFLDLFSQFPVVSPYVRAMGAGPLMIGVSVATYDVANLFGNLVAPFVLARWGRKRPLVGGLLTAAGALVLYGVTTAAAPFALVRGIHGLAQAILSPGAFVLLSESVPARRRAQAMGTAGVFIAIAAVLGPSFAGIAAGRAGPRAVFLAVAVLLALAALVTALRYRADRAPELPAEPAGRVTWGTLWQLAQRPSLIGAYAAALTWTAGIGTLVVHLPLLLETPAIRGRAYAVYALVALVMFAGPAPWLANRFGRMRPTSAGLALVGLALLTLGFSSALAPTGLPGASNVYSGMALFGLGFGILFPAVTALVADATQPHERGAAYGIFYAAYSLGVAAGEIGSGQLARAFGPESPAPFLAFGAVALVMAPAILLVGRAARTRTALEPVT
ncbi:MAG TPA: MFS transporter [Chloroflexota bacterium]|nr:MFS transporter [Chloroflexota bacterium]